MSSKVGGLNKEAGQAVAVPSMVRSGTVNRRTPDDSMSFRRFKKTSFLIDHLNLFESGQQEICF